MNFSPSSIARLTDSGLEALGQLVNEEVAKRRWIEGDTVFWITADRVNQGTVSLIRNGSLRIKKKGDLMWSTSVGAGRAYRTLEKATWAWRAKYQCNGLDEIED